MSAIYAYYEYNYPELNKNL